MALFGLGTTQDLLAPIHGEGVFLRAAEMRDFDEWAHLRDISRDFLKPWEPTWPGDDLKRTSFRRRLRRYGEEIMADEAYPFLIFRQQDKALLGGLTLGQVRRGVGQAATLGYWMGAPYAGQGYMARAVRAITGFAFTSLRLHRIEASCLPHNLASIHLLTRCGFQKEGLARAYLKIDGLWQDHLLFALLENDPIPQRRASGYGNA